MCKRLEWRASMEVLQSLITSHHCLFTSRADLGILRPKLPVALKEELQANSAETIKLDIPLVSSCTIYTMHSTVTAMRVTQERSWVLGIPLETPFKECKRRDSRQCSVEMFGVRLSKIPHSTSRFHNHSVHSSPAAPPLPAAEDVWLLPPRVIV